MGNVRNIFREQNETAEEIKDNPVKNARNHFRLKKETKRKKE